MGRIPIAGAHACVHESLYFMHAVCMYRCMHACKYVSRMHMYMYVYVCIRMYICMHDMYVCT